MTVDLTRSGDTATPSKWRAWRGPALAAAAIVAYVIAAASYVRYEVRSALEHAATHLMTVADAKAGHTGAWYADRIADGTVLASSSFASEVLRLTRTGDTEARASVVERLESKARREGYAGWLVAGPGDMIVAAQPADSSIAPATLEAIERARSTHHTHLSALYRSEPDQSLALDVVVPIPGPDIQAFVVLRVDPARALLPILEDRTSEHLSMETLLVRHEEDMIVFVAGSRLTTQGTLDLRLPFAGSGSLVAAQARDGVEGPTRGTDYRGVPVVAAIRPVPDTPWVLIVKADESEIAGPVRQAAMARAFVVALLLFAVAGGVSALAHHRLRAAVEHEIVLTRRLAEARRMESLANLAGGLAHDLNNVLGAISNVVSMHRKTAGPSDPLAKSFDTIAAACARGRSVVNSLLYFSKDKPAVRGTVDLNDLAAEAARVLEPTLSGRARLALELDETIPPIEGDAYGLLQALINVCLNSNDAISHGGNITIRTRRSNGGVELAVIDDGAGMSPEARARATEPFFTTKSPGGGAGLGLAMVYGTVNAHKGTLEFRSEKGRGTEVSMRFPASAVATPVPDAPVHVEDLRTPVTGRTSVLLVDDDELILETFVPLLEAMGHKVTAVSGGRAAIETLENGLMPDLVILDMRMPDMPGDEALPHILRLRPGQRVLICTGYSDVDLRPLQRLSPHVSIIRKPFTADELQSAISGLQP